MTAIPEPLEYSARPVKGPRRRGRDGGRRRQADDVMVPQANVETFDSYYGHNIVKPAPWGHEIPAYLFTGGLAGGTGLLASGGEMIGNKRLQRNTRLVSLAALGVSGAALVADLGKPSRFLNMMRTVKLTSPMSVGSWILTGFGAFTSVAAATEVATQLLPKDSPLQPLLPFVDRVSSWGAGAFSAPLAAYTAVLLSDTATPTWHAAYHQLPFVFIGSALGASGGSGMVVCRVADAGPARNFAVIGSTIELAAHTIMENRLGLLGEPLHHGHAGTLLKAAKACTVAGVALTLVGGRRRPVAVVAGLSLMAGSALTRFGIFEAGIASAKDPKYTVVPQKERLQRKQAETLAARRAQMASEHGVEAPITSPGAARVGGTAPTAPATVAETHPTTSGTTEETA